MDLGQIHLWGSGLRQQDDRQGCDEVGGVSELAKRTKAITQIKQMFSSPREHEIIWA